jgi:hypothetical protein
VYKGPLSVPITEISWDIVVSYESALYAM